MKCWFAEMFQELYVRPQLAGIRHQVPPEATGTDMATAVLSTANRPVYAMVRQPNDNLRTNQHGIANEKVLV